MGFGESQSVPKNVLETATAQVSESAVENAEKKETDGEIQPEVVSVDNVHDLKSQLKITTEEYRARVAANEEARKKLAGILGEGNVNLGEAGAEEELLKKSMEDAQAKINSLEAEPIQSGIEAGAEPGEVSAEAIEAQLKEMPENERQKIEVGLHNIGFFGQKLKSEIFSGTLDFATKLVGKEGIAGKFIKSLSETYKKDGELAERNILNSESDEGRKLTKYSNLGKTASGLLKIATWIGRGPAMGVSSVFARGMEAAKEMRLGDEKVVEKTRIADMEAAYEEAMKIHEDAKKSSKGEEPSKIDLQRAYEKNIPKDVLERLSKNYEPGTGSKFLSGLMRKPMEFSAKRLNKQIEAVENNKNLSDAEREAKRNKLLDGYSKKLTDLDRMVSQTGELDTIATGLKYAEVAGKAVMAGLMAKTAYEMLQKAWNSMPEILDALGAKSVSASELPAGLSSTKGSDGDIFKELEYQVNNKGGEPIRLEVQKGGSLEGSIIKYLNENPDAVNKYNQANGGRDFDTGQIAHRMALDLAEEKGVSFEKLNEVYPGQKIELGSGGTKVMEFAEGKGVKGSPFTQEEIEEIMRSGKKTEGDGVEQFLKESSAKLESGKATPLDGYKYQLLVELNKTTGRPVNMEEVDTILMHQKKGAISREAMSEIVDKMKKGALSKEKIEEIIQQGSKTKTGGLKTDEWIEGGQKAKGIKGIPYTQEDIDNLSNKGSEGGLKQEDIDVLGQRGSAGTPEDIAGKAPEEIKGIPYNQEDLLKAVEEQEKPKDIPGIPYTQEDIDNLSSKGSESGPKQEDIEILGNRGSAGTPEDIAGKAPEQIKGAGGVEINLSDPKAMDKLGKVFIDRGYPKELLEKMVSANNLEGRPGPGGRMLEFVDKDGKKWNVPNNFVYKEAAKKALEKLSGEGPKLKQDDIEILGSKGSAVTQEDIDNLSSKGSKGGLKQEDLDALGKRGSAGTPEDIAGKAPEQINVANLTGSSKWSQGLVESAHVDMNKIRTAEDAEWLVKTHHDKLVSEYYFPTKGKLTEGEYGIKTRNYTTDDLRLLLKNTREMKKVTQELNTKFGIEAYDKRMGQLDDMIKRLEGQSSYSGQKQREILEKMGEPL